MLTVSAHRLDFFSLNKLCWHFSHSSLPWYFSCWICDYFIRSLVLLFCSAEEFLAKQNWLSSSLTLSILSLKASLPERKYLRIVANIYQLEDCKFTAKDFSSLYHKSSSTSCLYTKQLWKDSEAQICCWLQICCKCLLTLKIIWQRMEEIVTLQVRRNWRRP